LNIEEYISSGILEAYALGELSAGERAAVEKSLALYPQLKEELSRIEEAQENLLRKAAIEPNASVKKNLFKKIDERKQETNIVSMPVRDSQITFWKYAAAASVAITLMTSYLAYNYYDKWRSSENNLQELIAQNQQLAQDYNTVNQRLDKIESDIGIIENPAFTKVVMKGSQNAPDAMASVYWNASTQEVYLSIQNMKTLAQENQYQLWAMVDGKPVDAGVFDADPSGLLKMKKMEGAGAFAVTIEPRGGKPTPSLETLQMIGNVVKS
jgi:anti-sigma-K factor RskA